MNKLNLLSSNKDKAILTTSIVVIFALVTIVIPLLFVKYIPNSIIGNYFFRNVDLLFFVIPLVIYFFYTGVFIYHVKIDPYIIAISSYNSIPIISYEKDEIDISHLMLQEYAFFNRRFSLNRTLMIKIKTDSDKIVAKRFTLSLVGYKEQNRIKKVLDQILLNNRKWKRKL